MSLSTRATSLRSARSPPPPARLRGVLAGCRRRSRARAEPRPATESGVSPRRLGPHQRSVEDFGADLPASGYATPARRPYYDSSGGYNTAAARPRGHGGTGLLRAAHDRPRLLGARAAQPRRGDLDGGGGFLAHDGARSTAQARCGTIGLNFPASTTRSTASAGLYTRFGCDSRSTARRRRLLGVRPESSALRARVGPARALGTRRASNRRRRLDRARHSAARDGTACGSALTPGSAARAARRRAARARRLAVCPSSVRAVRLHASPSRRPDAWLPRRASVSPRGAGHEVASAAPSASDRAPPSTRRPSGRGESGRRSRRRLRP